jgi:hydrogenase large subunit
MASPTSTKSATGGRTITIDPVTRVEGHMRVDVTVDGGEVKDARCAGTLFRGFENILAGRHPFDAVRLTQRVCGVCPMIHSQASATSLDAALGVADKVPPNGRLVRNLLLSSNYLQSHILHFFTLAALDYVDVTAAADYAGAEPELMNLRAFIDRGALAPFVPRYEGDYRCTKQVNVDLVRGYVRALNARRVCQEMIAVFGGKMPHNVAVVPGGVLCEVTADKIAFFMTRLGEVSDFIDQIYIPAVLTVAGAYSDYFDIGKGCDRYLAYGVFNMDDGQTDPLARKRLFPSGYIGADGRLARADAEKITEDVAHSRYTADCAAKPADGKTVAEPEKPGAYSWLKAPRYDGAPAEVGPLARTLIGHAAGGAIKPLVDNALKATGLAAGKLKSVLGRHLARALECRLLATTMADWCAQLKPGDPVCADLVIPEESRGAGLMDGPRGALGHWIHIQGRKIGNYQLVVPTTWNGSPRDAAGTPGPIEQALIGTKIKDPANPFEVVRIIRSFDPCLACAIHVANVRGGAETVHRVI